MSDAPELKPCPFCGAGVALQEWRGDDQTEYVGIRCECSAEVSRSLHWYGDDIAARGAEAIAAWNTRADLTTAAETAAREEGVRLGLTAAWILALRHRGSTDTPERIAAINADPAQVAAIATINQGD